MAEKTIETPIKITAVNIEQFLKIAQPIFDYAGKQIPDITFDTRTSKKADIIGLLLIYKFYEYTVRKACFKSPKSKIKGYISDELQKYGLKPLVDNYINYKEPQKYDLKFKSDDNWFISPIQLEKDSSIDEVSIAGADICKYYKGQINLQYIIITCLGELAQNFKSHAVSDTTSIISATGNKVYFEIGCVDTGDGIVSTLESSYLSKGMRKSRNSLLLSSLERGITSKAVSSGHMGYGLWLIKELVIKSKGELHVFSEGYFVRIHNGRIKSGTSSYWKGTIVYLKLPISKSDVLFNYMLSLKSNHLNIKINKV